MRKESDEKLNVKLSNMSREFAQIKNMQPNFFNNTLNGLNNNDGKFSLTEDQT